MAGMTLVEFLLTRIAEDEVLARTASTGQHWSWTEDGAEMVSDHVTEYRTRECIIDTEGANPPGSGVTGQHIARHDPARVLAECEAKRRIVDLYAEHRSTVMAYRNPRWADAMNDEDRLNHKRAESRHRATEDVLRLLALPYADHPDYREEWRP